jgi:hypothetical protein
MRIIIWIVIIVFAALVARCVSGTPLEGNKPPQRKPLSQTHRPQVVTSFGRRTELGIFAPFTNDILRTVERANRPSGFSVLAGPQLRFASGRIFAIDGFAFDDRYRPLSLVFPKGVFRVQMLVGHRPSVSTPFGPSQASYEPQKAAILFSEKPVTRWQTATAQDDGTPHCITSDSGTVAFIDAAAIRDLADYFFALPEQPVGPHRPRTDGEIDLVRTSLKNPAFGLKAPRGDALIMGTGIGDGCFNTSYGFATDGSLAALMVDFTTAAEEHET